MIKSTLSVLAIVALFGLSACSVTPEYPGQTPTSVRAGKASQDKATGSDDSVCVGAGCSCSAWNDN